MGKNLSTSSSKKEPRSFALSYKRLPWPFIASLVIFMLLQLGLANNPAFWQYVRNNALYGKNGPLRYEAMLRNIPCEGEYKKVLILGTSQIREAVDMPYLNEQFKSKKICFYNFGIGGSSHPIDNFMLKERILEVNPDVIVYTPFVESFYTPYKVQPSNHLEYFFDPEVLPYFAKHLKLEDYDKDMTGDFIDVAISSFSLFYKFRDHFSTVFVESMKYSLGLEERPKDLVSPFSEDSPPSYFVKSIDWIQKNQRYRYTRYTDLNRDLFERFVKTIKSREVPFIVMTPPAHPLMDLTCPKEIREEYNRFLEEKAFQYGYKYTPRKELPRFSSYEFVDFLHLNEDGRERFTKFMVGYFERELDFLNNNPSVAMRM